VTRVAFISDIHGNAVALDAVLADLRHRPVDGIVCLGDIAAGGPQPREAINRLRKLNCVALRGNADAWLLEGLPPGTSEATQRLADIVTWTHEMLVPDESDYLAALPSMLTIPIGEWTVLCFHGSPRTEVDALLAQTPDAQLDSVLAGTTPADGFACGHTHLQLLRRYRRGLLFNPGSVGLPLGSLAPTPGGALPTWAEYALAEVDRGDVEVTFRRVPVDVDALAATTEAMPNATWASDLERRIMRWNAKAVA
jgi:putative phosphoesterase